MPDRATGELGLMLFLAALAGVIDAYGFLAFSGYFLSFITGNTTRLGVAAVRTDGAVLVFAGGLIGSFVGGVAIAALASAWAERRRRSVALAVTTALLLAAAIGGLADWPTLVIACLIAAAMGAENGVFTNGGLVSVPLTYMTGTLVRATQGAVLAALGRRPRWEWVVQATIFLAFTGGVAAGAVAFQVLAAAALWVAVAMAMLLTMLAFRTDRSRPAA